jgi:SAM-dependent methyltransferase
LPIRAAPVTIWSMTHGFDKDYWEQHWHRAGAGHPPNPYLARETAGLEPGTALDAGCGAGAEAVWLAAAGWRVTAADISAEALSRAAALAENQGVTGRVRFVEADLTTWDPQCLFDLVTTHYAHPAMSQLAFYERVCGWVAPGGTLLIVGHLHGGHEPADAAATPAAVTALLDSDAWDVRTAREHVRTITGHASPLRDGVVRATRRGAYSRGAA